MDTSSSVTQKVCASALPENGAPKNSLGILLLRLQLPDTNPSALLPKSLPKPKQYGGALSQGQRSKVGGNFSQHNE